MLFGVEKQSPPNDNMSGISLQNARGNITIRDNMICGTKNILHLLDTNANVFIYNNTTPDFTGNLQGNNSEMEFTNSKGHIHWNNNNLTDSNKKIIPETREGNYNGLSIIRNRKASPKIVINDSVGIEISTKKQSVLDSSSQLIPVNYHISFIYTETKGGSVDTIIQGNILGHSGLSDVDGFSENEGIQTYGKKPISGPFEVYKYEDSDNDYYWFPKVLNDPNSVSTLQVLSWEYGLTDETLPITNYDITIKDGIPAGIVKIKEDLHSNAILDDLSQLPETGYNTFFGNSKVDETNGRPTAVPSERIVGMISNEATTPVDTSVIIGKNTAVKTENATEYTIQDVVNYGLPKANAVAAVSTDGVLVKSNPNDLGDPSKYVTLASIVVQGGGINGFDDLQIVNGKVSTITGSSTKTWGGRISDVEALLSNNGILPPSGDGAPQPEPLTNRVTTLETTVGANDASGLRLRIANLETETRPANEGGTGLNTYQAGDLIYATGATTLNQLRKAATGNVLLSGDAPSWGKVELAGVNSSVNGILPVTKGGTGASPVADDIGKILTATGAGTADWKLPHDITYWSSSTASNNDIKVTDEDLNFTDENLVANRTVAVVTPTLDNTASTSVFLQVGNSSRKQLVYFSSSGTATAVTSSTQYWKKGKPIMVIYNGSYWCIFNPLVILNSTFLDGVLPLANGGTGLSAAPSSLTDLESTTARTTHSGDIGVKGVLPIAHGGTGASVVTGSTGVLQKLFPGINDGSPSTNTVDGWYATMGDEYSSPSWISKSRLKATLGLGASIQVTQNVPSSPDANTLYFITG